MSLLSELKRRNVFRVALLYVVASWLIMQVADVGVSLLGLPDWTGRLVFLLLTIGFPLVMVFSWVYEITPEGVKREKDVRRDDSITHETARKLNTAVIVLLLISVGGLIADRLIPEQAAVPSSAAIADSTDTDGPTDASIAVLPFVNMSADQENEYFSDGLSEELLNLLARMPELQVASRTSAFSFKGTDAGIPEIAEKLKVAHVLEGSVRKAGNEIRITAQLIKASDGFHLWSATWDRTLNDVFAIQDEIAAAVVRELQVTLLGEVPHARVTDPQAYEYYLQARAASNRNTEESLNQAVQLLTQALAVDPEFADGWAALSTIQTNQTGIGFVPPEEGFERARISGERALKIDPDHARALSGLAWNAMYWERDFAKAHGFLQRAIETAPGNPSVLNSMAVLNGAFGRREAQVSMYEAALERDPVAMSVLANLTGTYNNRGEFEKSDALIERMREISPDSMFVPMSEAWTALLRGEAEVAHDRFSELGEAGQWGRLISLYDLGRDDELAVAFAEFIDDGGARPTQVATVYGYIGENDLAFEWFDRAYEERDDWLIEIRMYGGLDRLQSDPRWEELLARIGISDADAERIGL